MTSHATGGRPAASDQSAAGDASAMNRPTISMVDAVGYPAIPCDRETPVSDALTLKNDRLFALVDQHGNVAPAGNCSLGVFDGDTRILSHYELRMAGSPPAKLSTQVIQPYYSQIDLAVTDHEFGGNTWDPKHAIYIRRELILEGSLMERLTLTNFLVRPIDFWVELHVGCDFADIFEVRGWKREKRGTFLVPIVEAAAVQFAYRGRDGRVMTSAIRLLNPPDALDARTARWAFRLSPGKPVQLEWIVKGDTMRERSHAGREIAFDDRRRRLSNVYDRWRSSCSRWTSGIGTFDATITRAIDDLRSLYITADGARVISAGIPW